MELQEFANKLEAYIQADPERLDAARKAAARSRAAQIAQEHDYDELMEMLTEIMMEGVQPCANMRAGELASEIMCWLCITEIMETTPEQAFDSYMFETDHE